MLAVTNKRALYVVSGETVEMPYSKLVNLTVSSDGILFHLSNRVNAPLFAIKSGSDVVAAVVNAAVQTSVGAPSVRAWHLCPRSSSARGVSQRG
jgi:hypothetical protein